MRSSTATLIGIVYLSLGSWAFAEDSPASKEKQALDAALKELAEKGKVPQATLLKMVGAAQARYGGDQSPEHLAQIVSDVESMIDAVPGLDLTQCFQLYCRALAGGAKRKEIVATLIEVAKAAKGRSLFDVGDEIAAEAEKGPDGWFTVSPGVFSLDVGNRFTIEFPALPRIDSKLGEVKATVYFGEKFWTAAFRARKVKSSDGSTAASRLRAGMDGALEAAKGRLIKSHELTVGNHAGVDYQIELGEALGKDVAGKVVRSLEFDVLEGVYTLTIVGTAEGVESKEANRFFDSIELNIAPRPR